MWCWLLSRGRLHTIFRRFLIFSLRFRSLFRPLHNHDHDHSSSPRKPCKSYVNRRVFKHLVFPRYHYLLTELLSQFGSILTPKRGGIRIGNFIDFPSDLGSILDSFPVLTIHMDTTIDFLHLKSSPTDGRLLSCE